jgi:tRNA(Ile)-lysidine synthase
MFRLACAIPREICIAVSGGLDSMVALHFLQKSNRKIEVCYFDHGSDEKARLFIEEYCEKNNLKLHIGVSSGHNPKVMSAELFWRTERYAYFDDLQKDVIITCHHLDDAVESWLFTSIRSEGQLIPIVRGKYFRPFIFTTKNDMHGYAKKHGVCWVEDESNYDLKHSRNRIRHKILPEALKINPGLYTTVRNKYERMK